MPPIHVFLDTSVMPRSLTQPHHDFEQLIKLSKAKQVKIHMSEIAIREWLTL